MIFCFTKILQAAFLLTTLAAIFGLSSPARPVD